MASISLDDIADETPAPQSSRRTGRSFAIDELMDMEAAPQPEARPQATAYVEPGMPAIMTPVPMGEPRVAQPIPEPAPFVPQDERTIAGAMGRQFARGAIETAGLVPKGAAALGYQAEANARDFAARQLQVMDRIDRGEPVPEVEDAEGYQHMPPALRAQRRAALQAQVQANATTNAPTPIEQRATFRAGEAIDEFGRQNFPTTREEDAAFLTGQVPRALGSTAAMAPVALAGATFGALGRLLAGVGLATTGSGEAAQNAVDRRRALEDMVRSGDAPSPESYPSDRQIATAAGQGLAPGALDAAAIDNLLRPVVRAPGFRGLIAAVAKKAVEQGVVEGTTEGVQQVAQNLIQRFGYNPDQATLDQVAENVLVGGAVGVLTGGLAGGVIRPARSQADQPPQAIQVQGTRPDVSRETVGAAALVPQEAGAEAGGERVGIPQAAPQATPAALPPPATPSPEDLSAVLEDPRPVAEIMAERERRAQRQATVAAVEREDGPEAAAAVAKVMDGAGRREAPMQAETVADVDMAAAQAQQPTPAQAEAGNFRKGHVRVQGLDIAIEVPRGGERVGVGPDGRPWSVTMPAHYGYLKAGKDSGDGKIDVFVGDEIDAPRVYVIDQIDPRTGKFDEPKVLLGMDGRETAIAVYEASYSDGSGPARMGAITRMTVAELRAWLRDGNPRKPLAYKPAPATPEPSGVALDDVADAPDPLAAAVAPQDQVPQPPASPTAAPAAFPLQGGQASAAAPPVPAPVQGPAVAPADPLATVRNLASRVGVNLTGAELVDIRELLADGAHPEIALEIALERSGLRGAGEIAEATQEGAPDGQDRAAPDAGAADGTGEVADAQGARAEPADRAAAPEGAQRSDPIAGGEQGQGDARGVEPGASVPTEPTAEPARKPTARERREEKLRQKRDAEIKRREAAKKAIATRKKNAGPLNIVQAIAAAGGMKDAGGDLQAIMGRPNHMVPVFGALRSERGMEPDRAREMLVEAGFLPEGATLNDLYAAIDRTIRGNPVYSERDTNAALDKARERRERRAGEGPRYQRPRTDRITVAKDSLSDEQMVIPGAERVAAEGKKAAKAPQRSVAETPLFGGEQAATREVKDEDRKREAGRQGALFQKSQIDTPEFLRWFGDSRVVDENGQPLVVYHGTPGSSRGPITAFAKNARGGLGGTVGFWFASTRQAAEQFKRPRFAGVEPEMIAAHLSISRPAEFNGYRSFLDAISARPGDSPEKKAASLRRALQRAGHDGIVIRNSDTDRGGLRDDWVAFEPTQIKSATANAGTFNPNDPDIRAQASDRFRVAGQIDAVNSLTPQDRRRRDAVMQAVTTTVRRMAGAATPQTVTADIMEADGQELWGAYSPADHLLAVSTRSPDPIGTVRHETIHVLRQLGLIDGAAWSALEDAAERGDWLTKHEITDRWGDQLTREQALEEAIAEEFGVGLREGVWKTGNARVDAIFQRIAEFFRRVRAEIKRALSAAGMRDLSDADVAEMVFSLIERGAFREGRGATAGQRSVMAQPAAESRLAFQVPEIGARAAAARPMARRLRDLRSAIADLRGGNNDPLAKVRVPNDIGWARKTMVTPRTIAAYFPSFADVFFAGVRQFRTRDKSISELTEIARPYLDLDQASKERVNKVVEHGRMAGEVYAPDADGTIKVANKVGQQIKGKIGGVTLMKDGETITLTPDEARAYRAYRKVMDVALDKFRDQVLREWGFDPADPSSPKTADGVDDLVDAEENAGERARLKSLAQVLSSIQQAKKRGYVPFTRYGSHYVTVTTLQDGKRAVVHREHIEPGLTTTPKAPWVLKKVTIPRLEQEAAALRRRLAEIYPPDQGFEISELREVSPDNIGDLPDFSDLDAIIQAANLPPEQAAKVQQAIGEVIQKRGFRAHFIKSRNIPGYSVDFERSLADYIVGISGYLARREHLPEIEQGIASIPATQPELRRYAKEWNDYIQNPSEELQPLRQAGFLWYLSGRFSSAVVNLSQVPMVTQPYLSMFAGSVAAAREIARAYKAIIFAVRPWPKSRGGAGLDLFDPNALPEDVRDVVKAALAEGTLLPIETFQEMARAQGKTPKSRSLAAKAKTVQDGAAFMFQAAERANRLVSFIAAYRLAQRPEVMGRIRADLRDNPLWTRRRKDRQLGATEFAAFVVEETQFVLGKVNRARMMRGPGAVIFQFKAFAANYLELMARLGAFGSGVHRGGHRYAAIASMMFAMFLVGGLFGLPGAEDGLEMIEALIKTATGIDPQFEDGLRESAGSLAAWAARQLGADDETQAGVSAVAGRVAARGVARETGIDVSQRIGMGRVAPKPTGTEQDDFWYRAIGLAGIPGSWILRGVDTGYAVARGDWLQAGIRLAPEAIADQMRAYQLADEGVKTIAKGRKVITPDETLPDGTVAGGASNVAKRVLGFQPTGISRAREQMNAIRRAGEAPRDLFADFNLRRANIQAAINRASDTLENATSDKERASAKAAVERETKRLERVMGEIETYNKSAPAERSYKIDNPGYRQQLKIANQGQRATQIKKVPMRVRGSIEDIRARY